MCISDVRMGTAGRWRTWLLLVGLLSVELNLVGCRPQAVPQFTPSAEVKSLTELAEDDADRQRWVDLQKQIESELTKQFGTPTAPVAFGVAPTNQKQLEADQKRLQLGAEVFAYRCQQCHGVNGDGKGTLAKYLRPAPRDYTKGIFKFTSTPYGAKPRRADIIRTLQRGVTGTSMPTFGNLSPEELDAVADYVIHLSQRGEMEQELVMLAQDEEELDPELVKESADTVLGRWKEAQSELVMPLTPMPPMTPETIAKGHELFLKQVCNKCHGVDGRGGLAGNIEVGKDAWGQTAAAADLTSGMFRGGGRPIDIYRRIYSGINGTPMPGFADVFAKDPDAIWYLVHYVRDTGERRRRNLPPVEPAATPAPATSSTSSSGAQ